MSNRTRGVVVALVVLLLAILGLYFLRGTDEAPPAAPTPPAPAAAPAPKAPRPVEPASAPAPPPPPAVAAPPVQPPPEGDVLLEVVVRTLAAKPAEGVEVTLCRVQEWEGKLLFPGGTSVAPGKTNATGSVVLGIGRKDLKPEESGEFEEDEDTGELLLYARRGNEAALLGNLDLPEIGTVRREMTLWPAKSLAGIVRRRDGPVVAGAKVELSLHSPEDGKFDPDVRTVTDADGRFRFPPVPEEFVSELSWLIVNFPGCLERQVEPRSLPFGGPDLEVVLDPIWTLKGRCTAADGVVLAGVKVRVESRSSSDDLEKLGAVTDALGRFAIADIERDSVDVRFEAPSLAIRLMERVQTPGKPELDLGDVVLTTGNRIHGVVLGEGGESVPSALVLLTDRWGGHGAPLAQARTDARGKFSFAVEEGVYGLVVLPDVKGEPDEEELMMLTVFEMPDGGARRERIKPSETELRLFLRGLRVQFRFLDAATRTPLPLKGARVELHPVGGSQGSEDAWSTGWSSDKPETKDVRIDVRKAGAYECKATSPGYEAEHPKTVEIGEERESVVEVLLRAK